ncbi:MAG: iron-containing redox enzyme family protein [Actinomycetota bacterium]
MQALPPPRGPRSAALIDALRSGTWCSPLAVFPDPVDPLADDDLHLALYLCYELHYRGISEAGTDHEWDPQVIAFRSSLEGPFEQALRAGTRVWPATAATPRAVTDELVRLAKDDGEPSLSRYLARHADLDAFTEFVMHRSLYTLKEADPHSFVIPRLEGAPKAALLEIQGDEYGGGMPDRMHATIFARTLRALGLDDRYGAYLHAVPGVTLATVNLVSLFSLHRRLRGAAMGHLALFELTSSVANRRYGNGLRRLGFGPVVTEYYDEHVEADAVHDMIATHDVVGRLVDQDRRLAPDVVFGARSLALVETRFDSHLLAAWRRRGTSLQREPLSA